MKTGMQLWAGTKGSGSATRNKTNTVQDPMYRKIRSHTLAPGVPNPKRYGPCRRTVRNFVVYAVSRNPMGRSTTSQAALWSSPPTTPVGLLEKRFWLMAAFVFDRPTRCLKNASGLREVRVARKACPERNRRAEASTVLIEM